MAASSIAAVPTAGQAPSSAGLILGLAGLFAFAILSGIGVAIGELDAMVISVSLIGAIATLIDFRVGAVLMMVMLPLEGSTYFPKAMFGLTGLNPLNLTLMATLASYVVRGRWRGFLPRPLLLLYVAPIVVAGVIGAQHVDHIYPFFYEEQVIHYLNEVGYLRDTTLKPLLMVLIALLVGAAVERSKRPERFIVPIVVAVWIMGLMAIGFVVASGIRLGALADASQRGFFSAMGMHANDLGRLYAVAYALFLFTWWETKDATLKTTLLATMGVLAIALLLTFSRGAFLGFLVINALFVVWKFNAKKFGLALAAIGAAALLMPGFVMRRVTMGFDTGDANAVSAGRIEGIWQPLLPELWKHPLLGNGLESTMWSDPMWSGQMLTVTHPHSAYLQAMLDMGLIGLVLLLAYYLHVWQRLRDLGSNAYLSPTLRGFFQGAMAGLVCMFVSGLAGSSLRPVGEFCFLWLAIGIMYGQLARKAPDGAAPRTTAG